MAKIRPYFRWWFLLLLLPLFLYGGARWYVSNRIEEMIQAANEGSNSLAVENYTFGFFPIGLTVEGLTFDQNREAFSGNGTLERAEISGVALMGLLGSNPISANTISLRGLVAKIERKARPIDVQADSAKNKAYLIEDLLLEDIFLTATDRSESATLELKDFGLSLKTLHFPLQAERIEQLIASADSLVFERLTDSTKIVASDLDYLEASRSISLQSLHLTQGNATDLLAEGIQLSGVNSADFTNGFSLDSIRVERLAGGASRLSAGLTDVSRVQKGPEKAATESGKLTVSIGRMSLPLTDVTLMGEFGSGSFQGAIEADGVRFGEAKSITSLRVNGDTLSFKTNKGLNLGVDDLKLVQTDLQLPLADHRQGPTEITAGKFRASSDDGQSGTVEEVTYSSKTEEVVTGAIDFTTDKVSGKVEGIRVVGFARDSLMAGGSPRSETINLKGVEVIVNNPDGGHYDVVAPEVILTKIIGGDAASIDRVQVESATLKRWAHDGKEDIVARSVYFDQYGLGFPVKAEKLGPVKVSAATILISSSTQPVDYHFSNLSYDSRAGLLTLDSINRVNRYRPEELFESEIAKSWLSFSFDGLRLGGINHAALMTGELVSIDSLLAEDFRVLVVEDISLDLPPKEKLMPIQALREIGPRIVLKGARFSSTDIAYGVVDSVLEAKTIHFNQGTVRIENLDTEISTTDSVTLSMVTTFEGTAAVTAIFRLARDSSGRNFAARGEMSRYDLSGINPLMEVAAEAVVESGIIDKMDYQAVFKDEVMTGDMQLLYHDLDLKSVGGGAWLKNLLSGMLMKKENLIGEDFRPGQIYHEHTPDKSFLNAYWKGLVSGMRSSALSDIVLQKELE